MSNDRVRVKFCGMRRSQDVEHAVRLGADYVGFVFVPGRHRELRVDEAARWFADVDWGSTQRVGVFVDQPTAYVNRVVRRLGLHLVQLHGNEPRGDAQALVVPALRVVRVGAELASASNWVPEANVFAVLLDAAGTDGASGGLGIPAEPAALAGAMAALAPATRVLVAGGLTPENVGETVRRHRPWGVDVSSGIESAPGVKDPGRMARFLAAARGDDAREER